MILLASTSDKLQVVTGQAVTTDMHASYADLSAGVVTPGRTNAVPSTAVTTDLVGSPASSTYRTVKTVTVRNRHASSSVDITVKHTDGSTTPELIKVTLQAGETLHYDEGTGWSVKDAIGNLKSGSQIGVINTVTLGGDQTNNNGSANTIADVTGLSFSVISGKTYYFKFVINYTSAITTTGSRWAVNGPATTVLSYRSFYTLTATTQTVNYLNAYDTPAASNATSLTTGNIAVVEGIITPSADGTLIARFASEVSASAIIAKAGSVLQWMQLS